jgi:ELWxxDGT repeat protein
MRPSLLLLLLSFALPSPAAAAGLTPRLVKDINPIVHPLESSPADLLTLGGVTFFVANDGETGRELWRTDGSFSGTYRLTDACAGECSADPEYLAHSDRSVFFLTKVLTGSGLTKDLWVSDGTPATTFLLAGPLDFPQSHSSSSRWLPGQRVLYFAAGDRDRGHGLELWRSDGTPGGTYLLSDLRPGALGSDLLELADFKGQLFFSADDGQHGPSLWKSDGTPQGTQLVRDPLPSSVSHPGPGHLRVAGGVLYFVAPAPGMGTELWKSDGTTRGTAPLADLVRGPGSPRFYDFSVAGNRLFFVAEVGSQGQELWATDGTPRGTKALTSFPLASAFVDQLSARALPQTPLGSRIVFVVDDGPHGVEPWVSDGTATGTRLLKDICPGACSGAASAGAVLGDRVVFAGWNPVRGAEPWITDGTPAGTHIVRDLCRGSCGSYPHQLIVAPGKVFFLTQNEAAEDLNYWCTDGTAAGTVRLTNFLPPDGIAHYAGTIPGAALGDSLLFAARDLEHGSELWRSDGTASGAQLLADINALDVGGSNPHSFRALGTNVLFFADDGVHGFELWKSDGTAAGTSFVHEFVPGPQPRYGVGLNAAIQAAGKLFFISSPNASEADLWRTDGTEAGTLRLTAEGAQPDGELVAVGDTLFFGASDLEHGGELWKTDGTPAGTVLVKDLEPGEVGSGPIELAAFHGRLYFSANVQPEGRGLWVSDGTAAGTALVKIVNSGFGSTPEALTEHAGRLWFLASGGRGRELWSTDGTAAGTVRAVEFPFGSDTFSLTSIVSTGARLFVYGADSTLGFRLWVSDGTPAGAQLIRTAPESIDGRPLAFGGTLYFAGGDGPSSGELWKSDGTEAGTVPIHDRTGQSTGWPAVLQIFDGRIVFETFTEELWQTDGTAEGTFKIARAERSGGNGPPELVAAGPRLFFRGYANDSGTELWALEP